MEQRKVKHGKKDIFQTYVDVLMLLIENNNKDFMNKDIRERLFENPAEPSIKNMVKRVVDFYVGCNIFQKVTETIGEDGKVVPLKPNQYRVRLYDNKIDGYEDDDYYNVELHIPKDRKARVKLCETVAAMVLAIPYVNIYNPTLKTVLESKIFGLQTNFVVQTISKVILKRNNLFNEGTYPLDVIVNSINSKIDVNIEFENFGNKLYLQNVKITKLTFKEDGFDIHFDNFISMNHSDIKSILSIQNASEDGLRKDIEKVKEILSNSNNSDKQEELLVLLKEVKSIIDMFEF